MSYFKCFISFIYIIFAITAVISVNCVVTSSEVFYNPIDFTVNNR